MYMYRKHYHMEKLVSDFVDEALFFHSVKKDE